jgi:hypothetical protein
MFTAWQHVMTYDPPRGDLAAGGRAGLAAARAALGGLWGGYSLALGGTILEETEGTRSQLLTVVPSELVPTAPGLVGGALRTVDPATEFHALAADTLDSVCVSLARVVGWDGRPPPARLGTENGLAGHTEQRDASGLPAGVAVVVIGCAAVSSLAMAGAIAYTVSTGAELLDRHLQRKENTRRALEAAHGVNLVAREHRAAELTAGKALPYSEGEREALTRYAGLAKDAQAGMAAERKPSRVFSFGAGLGDLLLPAAGLAGAYLLLR